MIAIEACVLLEAVLAACLEMRPALVRKTINGGAAIATNANFIVKEVGELAREARINTRNWEDGGRIGYPTQPECRANSKRFKNVLGHVRCWIRTLDADTRLGKEHVEAVYKSVLKHLLWSYAANEIPDETLEAYRKWEEGGSGNSE